MYLSLNQAAKETGKSPSTISRAIKSGKLSIAEKCEDGSFKIDPAELFRVFPQHQEEQEKTHYATPHEIGSNALEMDILRELAEERKDALQDMKRRLDEAEKRAALAEERLNQSHEEARAEREKFMLWLEHKPTEKAEPEQPAEPQQAPRRRWWSRKAKA